MSFKREIWEGRLLANYHNSSIAEVISTPPSDVNGRTIYFHNVSDVAVKDYAGQVMFDELNIPEVAMNMDFEKYFAFKVKDIDKVQSSAELIDSHIQEASASVQEAADAYVLGFYTEAHADNVIGDDTTPIQITKDNAYDNIVDLSTKLGQKRVPRQNRFVVVNEAYLNLLAKDPRFTNQPSVLENGIVEGQKIAGMQVVVSEDVHTNANGDYKIMAVHKPSLGYGKQIDQMESLRLQDDFADGIRGLFVAGAKVLKPEGIAVLTANIG